MIAQKRPYLSSVLWAMMAWLLAGGIAHADLVAIRIGVGTSSEEQVWLMKARPDLTPNQGKAYTYDMSVFRSVGDRMVGFQAGQLDAMTTSTTAALFAASKGVELVIVAAMARESTQAFSTAYYALANSATTLQTLKGKTFGINGYRSSIEFYARIAVAKMGLDPDRDVSWLVVPLPQMAEAMRQGKIDVGVLPSTFAFAAMQDGDMRKLFDSAGISGIEEEFDVAFTPAFIKAHPDAVRAWAADFAAVTRYWNEHNADARKSLVDSGLVQVARPLYLRMQAKDDLLRTPEVLAPRTGMMEALQDALIQAKFQEERADLGKIVDPSFLPR